MISQSSIQEILEKCTLVDVISEFVHLKKKGNNYSGCCPFHNEKTASFLVSPSKNIYKCFGCGKAGTNVIAFIMEHEQLSYPDAIRYLGKKYRIDIREDTAPDPEDKVRNAKRESIKAVTSWAQKLFAANLKHGIALNYLKERKFSPEILQEFGVGFAYPSWNYLKEEGQKNGYSIQNLLEASLLSENEKGIYDYFNNRILFPICDVVGNVLGFSGRAIKAGDEPKYKNSRENELYHKSKALFGLSLARKEINKHDLCIVVEGNPDVLRLHELGFRNTVAPCGTALTPDQLALIRRFTYNILLLYDGDVAGTKAIFRNGDIALEAGMNVFVVSLPEGEDPDSFGLKFGAEVLLEKIKARQNFIQYKSRYLKQHHCKDTVEEITSLKEIQRSLALIGDPTARQLYIKQAAEIFETRNETLEEGVKKESIRIEPKETGWIGLEFAREAIKKNDECRITASYEDLIDAHLVDENNSICYAGTLEYSHIQEINSLTKNIRLLDPVYTLFDKTGNELPITILCKRFVEYHLNVKAIYQSDDYHSEELFNFIHIYAYESARLIYKNTGDEFKRKRLIEECAQLLSTADNTTITINTKQIAQILNLKEGDFKKVMKPFLDRKRSKFQAKNESIVVDGHRFEFDPANLPDYVDRTFFNKWGYFPAQDKNGRKIFYVFRTQNDGLERIGNFYMEPLFHVYDIDPNKNKRFVQINNADSGESYYMEYLSGNMVEFGAFKKHLFTEGGNVFSKGKSHHHEILLASTANDFPRCHEINEFGQQDEGFFAFANAIYSEGKVEYTNDLGLVEHKGKTYFSPAYSKVYSGMRKSNDKYENDRNFIYRENNSTDFKEWADLMNRVYKQNDNGKWALLFSIMSAFRSEIYGIDRLFTAPFFIGPTESGKTQIALSIRALFMSPDAPTFNLNSGTDAAFFTSMERYRDVAMIYEEYNDNHISDTKFQGLKAGVYDGEGKQKKKDATSKDLDISKVNCALVLLGQETPSRDDGALTNRCILLYVPKKDDWTEEERNDFDNLKTREKQGLSNVLIEILNQRDIVKKYYQRILREVYKEIKQDLFRSGSAGQSRVLNTVSLFLAMCKLFEQYVPTLCLPFTYKEFYAIAKIQIVGQSESLGNTSRLNVFFETLQILVNLPHNGIIMGRDLKIEWKTSLIISKNRTESYEFSLQGERKVLFLRLSQIHPFYYKFVGEEALKKSNLDAYIKNHPAYLGAVSSTRFKWIEYVESQGVFQDFARKTAKEASVNSSSHAFDYELLQELTGIDLEKYEEKPENGTLLLDEPLTSRQNEEQIKQTDIPF